MDHSEAQQNHAVERYLLNEMTGGERDGFEEHYFDCRLCAEDVTDGAKLVAAGRRVALISPNVVPMPRRWTAWLPTAAAAALVIVAVGIGVPRRSSPSLELAQDYVVDFSVSRGPGSEPLTITPENPIVYVRIPEEPAFPSYKIQIRDSAGKEVMAVSVDADRAKEQIPVLPRSLPTGGYVLAIEGVRDGNHTEIDKRELTVR
ncbi:MAG TPA: hypothetical protein VKB93_26275 [Thermoanaerobaculia bacterium]|nr:hypothetical protein [Thermoanaerobaculia bacterium]